MKGDYPTTLQRSYRKPLIPVFYHQVIIALMVIAAVAHATHFDGQPGCKTQKEVDQRNWRNNWDPTCFWRCESLNADSKRVTCSEETGLEGYLFDSTTNTCVSAENWNWSEARAPPSEPDTYWNEISP